MQKHAILILLGLATLGADYTPAALAGEPVLTEVIRQQWQSVIVAIERQYESWPAELPGNVPYNARRAELAIKLMDSAVNAEAYDLAQKYLLLAKLADGIDVKKYDNYDAQIRKLQAAPDDPVRRLMFVENFWDSRIQSSETECYEARQFLLATDKLPLSPEQRLSVYQQIINRSIARCQYRFIDGELEIALKYAGKIQVSFPTNSSASPQTSTCSGICFLKI